MKTIASMPCYKRIKSITWEIEWPCKPSQDILMQEYLYRSALWAKQLNTQSAWPFWNIAASIMPQTRINANALISVTKHFRAIKLPKESLEVLQDITGIATLPAIVQQTCVWYIELCALRCQNDINIPNLPDPFEPLINLYERGGVIAIVSSRWIRTLRSGFRNDINYWITHTPSTIDNSALDLLDAQYKAD